MKKLSKITLPTILTLGVILSYPCLASANNTNSTTTIDSTDKTSIQSTINDFFSIEKESLVNDNLVDSSKIIADDKLKESYNAKNKFKNSWYKKLNQKITSYDFNIKYDSFESQDDKYLVNVRRYISLVSTNFPDIVQKSADEKFSFVLEKKDNNWYIGSYADSEDDGFDGADVSSMSQKSEVTNERLSKWKKNLQDIDSIVLDFKNITLNKDKDKDKDKIKDRSASLQDDSVLFSQFKNLFQNQSNNIVAQYSGYNGIDASAYAQKWALSFNPAYENLTSQGGDCTNFASQAIHAGGVPYGLSWQPYTNAWKDVNSLRNYLVVNNYGTEFTYVPSGYTGQLIQFFNATTYTWSHSGILTYYSSAGDYLYCCHTDPKLNYALSNVFPGKYSKIRVFRIYT